MGYDRKGNFGFNIGSRKRLVYRIVWNHVGYNLLDLPIFCTWRTNPISVDILGSFLAHRLVPRVSTVV